MKAAILEPGAIRMVDRRTPQPEPGEVAVAVRYVGICGSDLARFDGRMPPGPERVFGHEFAGVVRAVGEGVALCLGQAVAVAPLLTCGRCAFCLDDHEYLCDRRLIFGVEVDGAVQETVCVPARCVLALPASVSMKEGALVEPLAVAVHAVRQAGDIKGTSVVVLGAGAIGVLIAQVARACGAGRVVLMDIRQERLELAARLGLEVAAVSAVPKSDAGILFEATGAPEAAELFAPLLAPLGVVVLVGRMDRAVPIDVDALLFKEARLVTSRYFSRADFVMALQLVTGLVEGCAPCNPVMLSPLVQAIVPFDSLADDSGRAVMALARANVRVLVEIRVP
jgi:2-desacetyl-2-hydroxyethyl bacteriochlorophyllide A dehydrogenase